MGASVCSLISSGGRTNGCDGEIAWSWSPGAETKLVGMIRWRRGQTSRSPGRSRITRSNHCAGKAGDWADLWFCRVLFCCTRTAGISRYPVFPAPLLQEEEGTIEQNSGASRREIAASCLGCLVIGCLTSWISRPRRMPFQALAACSSRRLQVDPVGIGAGNSNLALLSDRNRVNCCVRDAAAVALPHGAIKTFESRCIGGHVEKRCRHAVASELGFARMQQARLCRERQGG